jgi:hypothetical protein
VFEEKGRRCYLPGCTDPRPANSIDHDPPVERMPPGENVNRIEYLWPMHLPCNQRKGTRTIAEYAAWLAQHGGVVPAAAGGAPHGLGHDDLPLLKPWPPGCPPWPELEHVKGSGDITYGVMPGGGFITAGGQTHGRNW